MSTANRRPNHPRAYWDRAQRAVRDWSTDQLLPDYEGLCLVYLDTRGPVFLQTFLENGERCWQPEEAGPTVVPGIDLADSELVI